MPYPARVADDAFGHGTDVRTAASVSPIIARDVHEATRGREGAVLPAAETEAVALVAERETVPETRPTDPDNRRATRQTSNDTQHTTKETRRTTRRPIGPPQITLELIQEAAPATGGSGRPETVRIVNADDVAVLVTRVEAMHQPQLFVTGSGTIPVVGAYLLPSGRYALDPPPSGEVAPVWSEETVCPAGTLTAQQSGGTQTHGVSVPCGAVVSAVNTQTKTNEKQKRTKEQKQQRRDRRRTGELRRRENMH